MKVDGVITRTRYGWVVSSPAVATALGDKADPIGRLILPLHEEQVAQNDGEDGRPHWITIGEDVCDITGKLSRLSLGQGKQALS